LFDFTHHHLHIDSDAPRGGPVADEIGFAALRRLSKANMGWFRRSAKITSWRLTVHYSLTMPCSGMASALTSIKVKAAPAGKYELEPDTTADHVKGDSHVQEDHRTGRPQRH
jgi:hypothetical protein